MYYARAYQLIACTLLVLAACGQNNATDHRRAADRQVAATPDGLPHFSITPATATAFLKAKAVVQASIIKESLPRKKGLTLQLPLTASWKPFVVFTDTLLNTDDTEIREYQYVGQLKKIGFFVVKGSFWEHFEYYLIDQKSGSQTTLWNAPFMSAHADFIANLSMDYGLEGVPNGVQIWKVKHTAQNQPEPVTIEKYLELDQQIWAPADLVWESESALILQVADVDAYLSIREQPNSPEYYYLRISIP